MKWNLLSCIRLFATPWNSVGQNTGVSSLSLLQGIFLTQGSNPGLLHCRWILYQLSPKGSPPPLFFILWLLTVDLALHLLSLCSCKSCQPTLICFYLSNSYPWNLIHISTHIFSQQHLGLIMISPPSPDNHKTSPCFHCFLGHMYIPPKHILWITISAFLELLFLIYFAMSSYIF